jgi:2-polyprenyl-3-methyl-5-hydroxy-6-metoxy-1,4-benzoquinol methylase
MTDPKHEESLERVSLRKDPSIPVVVIREHLIRYVYAMQSITDKDVLDVACGSGYGMFLMSFLAKSVSGYDYSDVAIDEAKKFEYRSPVCLEIRDLNTVRTLENDKAKTFDVVTCFETIEHLDDPNGFLVLLKKHLNPGATLYISTPNKLDGIDKNLWHKTAFNINIMK